MDLKINTKAFFCLFLLFLISLNNVYSQSATATIEGKIVDREGNPIPYVNIYLMNTHIGTVSNDEGLYKIDKIPPDHYTLEASSVGYEPFTEEITLEEGDIMHLNLTIHENVSLELVTIVADGNPVTDKRSAYVARMPLKPLENPQNYDVIPRKQFEQQMAMSFGAALNYVGANSVVQTGTKGKEGIALRGFGVKTRTKDGMSSFSKTAIDPANIEKIEVIRGPSATLFGANLTSFGGLVNIITKKPYKRFDASLEYKFSAVDNTHRTIVDLNTPLDKNQKVMFRLNVAGETGDSWQDRGFKKSLFVAPALTWEISDKVKLDVSSEIYDSKFSTPYYLKMSKTDQYSGVKDIGIDWQKAYQVSDDMPSYAKQYNFSGHLYAELTDELTSDTKIAFNNNPMNGYINDLIALDNHELAHEAKRNSQRQAALNIQQNFHYNKDLGDRWKNKLLVGLDYYHFNAWEKANTTVFDTINFLNPAPFSRQGFNRANYEAQMGNGKYIDTKSSTDNYAAYLSDVISLDDRWFFMVSVRVDHFKNNGEADHLKDNVKDRYSQTAVSPKFGLVYQVVKDKVSLFGNYMNSFENQTGVSRLGKSFKPVHANQLEGGVKLSFFNNHLVSTTSFYNIKVDDILRDDPMDDDFEIQDGTRISRGVDFNLSYNPFPGLNLQAAYSYNFSKFTRADGIDQGKRPYKAGPQNTANFWGSYQLTKTKLKGLGVAFGGFYGSAQHSVKKRYNFDIPSYTVLNVSLFYNQPRYRIGILLDNLTNQDYWDYRLRKHNPRSISLDLKIRI